MSQLACDIVTPLQRLVSTEAHMVVVPGVEGEMGFLAQHAPLVSALADGLVRLVDQDSQEATCYLVQGGYVEVMDDKVIILANHACSLDDITLSEVRQEADHIAEELAQIAEDNAASRATLQDALDWCSLQIKHASAA